MKKSKLYILLIIIFFVVSFFTMIFYNYYKIYEVEEVNMSLIVKDFIGVALSKEEVTFGAIMPGGSSKVDIFLNNENERELRILLKPIGTIAKFVRFSDNNFILSKNETKKITLNAFAPEGTEFGNYTGVLRVIYYKV